MRYQPSLLDKLLQGDSGESRTGTAGAFYQTLEQVKESIARDLEILLNSRLTLDTDTLASYPLTQKSILAFGVRDFSGLSLASANDRQIICQSLEQAIHLYEPRLQQIRTTIYTDDPSRGGHLHFEITALLSLELTRQPVNFDAMLEPTTQHYSVQRTRRRAA